MNYKKRVLVLLFVFNCFSGYSQKVISLKEAISSALKNSPEMLLAEKKLIQQQQLKGSAINIDNPELLFEAPSGTFLTPGILQVIQFPSVYGAQYKYQRERVILSEKDKSLSRQNLIYNVKTLYNQLQFLFENVNLLREQDSVYSSLIHTNDVRYRVGEITNLEKINGEAQYKRIRYNYLQAEAELKSVKSQLLFLLGTANDTLFVPEKLEVNTAPFPLKSDSSSISSNPVLSYYNTQQKLSELNVKVERRKRYPGLVLGYLNQGSDNTTPLQMRLRMGVTIPLWQWAYQSNINAAKTGIEVAKAQSQLAVLRLQTNYVEAVSKYKQELENQNYFKSVGLKQAEELLKFARESYRLGNISYYNYLQNLELVFDTRFRYLENTKNLNHYTYLLQYLRGEE